MKSIDMSTFLSRAHLLAAISASTLLESGHPRHSDVIAGAPIAGVSSSTGFFHPADREIPQMRSCDLAGSVLLFTVMACTPPSDLSVDGLDAPPHFAPTDLFPNAPLAGEWRTVTDLQWDFDLVPFRNATTYEPDNGSHVVELGSSDQTRYASVVTDAELPLGLKRALHYRLPKGLAGGWSPSTVQRHPDYAGDGPLAWNPSLNTGHLYIGYWVRFSPNFSLNRNVGQKVLYLKSDLIENRSINHMPGINMSDGDGGDQLWPEYQPQSPFGNYRSSHITVNNLNDGRWHLVEMLQGPNTPGQNNGTLRLWIDGRLEGFWTDARFFDAGQVPSLNRLSIEPIYGGGTNPVPKEQWVRVGPILVRSH